ncbi:hypothetical protein [Devosia sp.]|uniref:hypothetical protein n=1 Tax=Devosia sp. TaxID=1871048 RepID=UPI002FC86B6C
MTPAANTPQPIYAEHGMGGWPLEPTTFLFTKPQGDLCRAGWIPGHVVEGTVLPRDVNGLQVIVLRSQAQQKAA